MTVEIIAEIGSNWAGDINLAKKMIGECDRAGVIPKFQMWTAKKLYPPDDPIWQKFPNLEDFELTHEKARELKAFADDIGVEWFTSVFHPEDVDFLEELGVARYKIAAGARDITLISKVVDTGKPIIMSLKPNEKVPFFFRTHPLCEGLYRTSFLYCVPKYPADYSDYKIPYFPNPPKYAGISDHTLGIVTSLTAVARGATIVEKHVMPEGGVYSPDACVSITISELEDLVKYARVMEKML